MTYRDTDPERLDCGWARIQNYSDQPVDGPAVTAAIEAAAEACKTRDPRVGLSFGDDGPFKPWIHVVAPSRLRELWPTHLEQFGPLGSTTEVLGLCFALARLVCISRPDAYDVLRHEWGHLLAYLRLGITRPAESEGWATVASGGIWIT